MRDFHHPHDGDAVLAGELDAVMAIAKTLGPDAAQAVRAFEDDLAAFFHMPHAVVVATDCAALAVVLGALGLGLGPGDEVVLAPTAPIWMLAPLVEAGVTPIFADLCNADVALADDALDKAMSSRTRAVIAVPVEDDPRVLRALSRRTRKMGVCLIIEISAGLASAVAAGILPLNTLAEDSLTSLGDVACLSLREGQPLSTGEGGVAFFRDPDFARRAKRYSQFGNLDGRHLGANHKLSPIQAALGWRRLRRLDAHLAQRPTTGFRYLPDDKGVEPAGRTDRPRLSCGIGPAGGHVTTAGRPLSDRFDPSSDQDGPFVARALKEGICGLSPAVARYEAALEGAFDAPHAICVSSGYAALVVALLALGLKPGDHVLLTPTCPLCTVFALTTLRLVPVFCDTRPDCFTADLQSAQARLTPEVKAIIDIAMWGYPVPADEVSRFARANGLRFVLDLALAHRAELHGDLLWRYADIATFSTHSSKALVTGEGGAVLTQDPELAKAVRSYRYPVEGRAYPAMNYALSGLQAALGAARLPRLGRDTAIRRRNMAAITDALDHPRLAALPVCPGGEPGGAKLIVRDLSGDAGALIAHLQAAGVPSDIATYGCRPLYEFPVLAARKRDCPNAGALLRSITTIPVHPDIGATDLRRIIGALNDFDPTLCRTDRATELAI